MYNNKNLLISLGRNNVVFEFCFVKLLCTSKFGRVMPTYSGQKHDIIEASNNLNLTVTLPYFSMLFGVSRIFLQETV